MKSFASLLLGLLLLASCETEGDCGNDFSTSFNIGFFTIVNIGTDSAETVNDTIAFKSIYATTNSDSLFVENDTIFSLDLTIDPSSTETTYIFDSSEGVDTISIGYVQRPRLISELCDPILSISQFDTLNFTYDSLIILNTTLRKSNGQTIQVFR